MLTPPIAARLGALHDQDRHAQAAQAQHLRRAQRAAAGRHDHDPAPASVMIPVAAACRAVQTALVSLRSGVRWARPSIS